MFKGVLLAAVFGGVVLVATVDDLRPEVLNIREPFDRINEALSRPAQPLDQQKSQWERIAKQANSICTDHEADELVIRLTLPRNRADYVEALGIVIERERLRQAQLAALKPPAMYELAYERFLHDRKVALAALKRLRTAAKEKNREGFVLAARTLVRAQLSINPYVQSAGMPACAL